MGRVRRRIEVRTLAPRLTDRVLGAWHAGGWARTVLLRRTAAGVLVVLAAALALAPQAGSTDGAPVVVARRDLAPGTELDASTVTVRTLPPGAIPDGAATTVEEVSGRLLAAPLRRGEPVTDVRLAGPELARAMSAEPGAVSVPLQLADPEIAALLHPGATVNVVTLGAQQDQPLVLARDATVLTVLPPGNDRSERGQLVLLALGPDAATRVAAASLSRPITVTVG